MKQNCYKTKRRYQFKTPRQIRRYIRRQAWYGSFRQLVWMEEDRTLRDKLRTLLGFDGPRTIVSAFDWNGTVMRYSEWKSANDAFNDWYVSE